MQLKEEVVISKFKRHGHPINHRSLEKTLNWLKTSENSLEVLLKKLDQLALDNSNP